MLVSVYTQLLGLGKRPLAKTERSAIPARSCRCSTATDLRRSDVAFRNR